MKITAEHEYIIIGAGPAGIQLGYFFQKNNFDYTILEANDQPGAFFKKFPRHRKLISINKVHTGLKDKRTQFRWDWNSLLNDEDFYLKEITSEYFPAADNMLIYLSKFVEMAEIKIHYNKKVKNIRKVDDFFIINTEKHHYKCKRLILATGLAEPYIPPIKGIEYAENYTTFDTNIEKYINKKVLIIGKGNSGFETADSLIPVAAQIHIVSPSSLQMAWDTHHVGHLRAVNNNLIDTDQLKSQNATIWGEIESIRPYRGQYVVRIAHTDSDSRVFTHVYDHLICCCGFRVTDSIFEKDAAPSLCNRDQLPKMTYEWESDNIKNLFFAGVLTQAIDYKESSSAFIHGFRYNTKCLFNIFSLKKGIPWTNKELNHNTDDLMDVLMDRINSTSSLWHQFNFLCDYIDLSGSHIRYYFDVPLKYALSGKSFNTKSAIILYFSHDKPKPKHLHSNFSKNPALHPVVKHIIDGEITSEHHMLEDLEAEWYEESLYIKPLGDFISSVLYPFTQAVNS